MKKSKELIPYRLSDKILNEFHISNPFEVAKATQGVQTKATKPCSSGGCPFSSYFTAFREGDQLSIVTGGWWQATNSAKMADTQYSSDTDGKRSFE